MIIALAQSEIAQFLECDSREIAKLWRTEDLMRSVYVDGRRVQELSHSSVFDVMEHYLRNEVLSALATDSDVETWLSALDEFVETSGWQEASFEDMIFALMQNVMDFSGRSLDGETLARQATHVLSAYFALLGFLEEPPRKH